MSKKQPAGTANVTLDLSKQITGDVSFSSGGTPTEPIAATLGRLGGLKTKERHGSEYYREIGRRGGRATGAAKAAQKAPSEDAA